ncbi:unnamed protein product [Ranitomeya imitator]|uniref:Galectin n=1 Tax=Ranitomeya imitator TaxID=111125 RepID=A0ABN9MF14_9NEOB|nr:unnamed protein product [Ranitomeya imitator]
MEAADAFLRRIRCPIVRKCLTASRSTMLYLVKGRTRIILGEVRTLDNLVFLVSSTQDILDLDKVSRTQDILDLGQHKVSNIQGILDQRKDKVSNIQGILDQRKDKVSNIQGILQLQLATVSRLSRARTTLCSRGNHKPNSTYSSSWSKGCTMCLTLTLRMYPRNDVDYSRRTDWFSIDYVEGNDVAFHINPRFDEKPYVVVRNSMIQGKWGQEERQCPKFPFQMQQPFKLQILFEPDGYKVSVNNETICKYPHRLKNFAGIRTIRINGAVTINDASVTMV